MIFYNFNKRLIYRYSNLQKYDSHSIRNVNDLRYWKRVHVLVLLSSVSICWLSHARSCWLYWTSLSPAKNHQQHYNTLPRHGLQNPKFWSFSLLVWFKHSFWMCKNISALDILKSYDLHVWRHSVPTVKFPLQKTEAGVGYLVRTAN